MCRRRLLLGNCGKSLTYAALWACLSSWICADAAAPADAAARALHLRPRYYRWYVDPGQQWSEKNTAYAFLDWKVPRRRAALVLVDVWDRHYIKDPEVRAEKIIQEKFARCWRRAGTAA